MMDLIQKASNHQTSNSSHTPNGLNSPNNKKSSTLSDLRQFRKDSANKPQQGSGDRSTSNTHQRAPIIPSLTPRNLTFGNSKSVGNGKTNSKSSNSSVTASKSSPPSSFS